MKCFAFILQLLLCIFAAASAQNEHTQECLKPCTLEFSPVCEEYNGKTQEYGNMCAFNNAKCNNPQLKLVKTGGC